MTKPRISYIGTSLPLSAFNDPIVRQKLNKTSYQDWTNKTALTNYVDSLYVHPDSDVYLHVKCGCGIDYAYTLQADVPAVNTNCTCGRKLFKYAS